MSNYTMSPVVNGEKKQMIVKVGDTSPLGLVADYDGSVVPDGWEEVDDTSYVLTDLPSQTSGTNSYTLYKIGKVIYFNCNLIWKTTITANTWETWGKLPTDIKPSTNIQCSVTIINGDTGNAMGYGYARIDTDGNLKIRSNTAYSGNSVGGISFSTFWII